MFIAKNNDLIVLAKDTREELEQALKFMVYTDIEETDIEYKLFNGEYLTDEQIQKKERERLDALNMTRGDMFEALILAFGKTKSDIRKIIENYEGLTDIERVLYLNRFDEALDFFRGYPAINLIGAYLGVTSEQLDRFFETKDYNELLPKEVKK